jgi:hypothetical protein
VSLQSSPPLDRATGVAPDSRPDGYEVQPQGSASTSCVNQETLTNEPSCAGELEDENPSIKREKEPLAEEERQYQACKNAQRDSFDRFSRARISQGEPVTTTEVSSELRIAHSLAWTFLHDLKENAEWLEDDGVLIVFAVLGKGPDASGEQRGLNEPWADL